MLGRMNRSNRTPVSAPFTLYVDAGGARIPVTVTRKRVRNLNLRVRGDGSVVMSIPVRTRVEVAQDFLDRRVDWIAERVRRRTDAEAGPRRAEDRASVPLWGSLVPLADALRRAGVRFGAAARPATFGAAPVRDEDVLAGLPAEEYDRLVAELYRREVARVLPGVAARCAERMGVAASSWSLRSMRTRWGSCTPATCAIRINTRLAAYPPACLEFVVAHELTHLMEPSHNARFHALLDTWCPANRELSALLRHPAREVAAAVDQTG